MNRIPPPTEEDQPTDNQENNGADKPAVDKSAIVKQMGAFDDGAIEMLHMFIEMTGPLIEKIQDAHAEKDFHGLKETAHSLKGAAYSACCTTLGDLAADLQATSEDGQLNDDLIDNILNEFGCAAEEIQALKAP